MWMSKENFEKIFLTTLNDQTHNKLGGLSMIVQARPWLINGPKVQGDFCTTQQRRSQIMEGLGYHHHSLLMLEHAIFIARWFSRERPKIFEPDTQTKGTLDNGLFQSGSILKYVVLLVLSLFWEWEKFQLMFFGFSSHSFRTFCWWSCLRRCMSSYSEMDIEFVYDYSWR